MTKWALIGASTIARQWMVDAIRQNGGEILTVLSADAARAKAFADAFGIATATTDLGEIVANPDIDAVYISTTNNLHHPQAMEVIAAGKHILCEKPLATTLRDGVHMVRSAQEKGIIFATNHHLRNAASHRCMRALIEEGAIGDILAARVFHAVYLPQELQGWRLRNPQAGAGVILDITVHDVDVLRFMLNENPREVMAMSRNNGMAAEGVEDEVMGCLRFESGVLAQFHDSFTTRYAGTGLEIHGAKGSLIAQDVMTQRPAGEVYLCTERGRFLQDFESVNLYHRSVSLFEAAMQGMGRPAADGYDGVWSLATALATIEAAQSGLVQKISVDL